MLMAEYSYEMDVEVQREEAAEKAAEETEEKKFVEHVNKIVKKLHITAEEACGIFDESYDRYRKIKGIK